jgi:hypothetical protein
MRFLPMEFSQSPESSTVHLDPRELYRFEVSREPDDANLLVSRAPIRA